MQMQLAKKKPSPEDNKSKRLPSDILGVCLLNYGNEFTDDAPLGSALINLGQSQSKLANFQEDYSENMKTEYMEKLDDGLALFKEYANLRKRLESRRLDYDAKIGRLQKSKKEKPELEQELQASKMKYEDAEYDVIQKMVSLQEFEDEHCDALQHLLDIQIEFFNQSLQVLSDVKSNWGQPAISNVNTRPSHTTIATAATSNPRLAALSRTSSHNNEEPISRVISRKASTDSNLIPPPVRRAMGSRSASFSEREEIVVPQIINRTTQQPPAPVLPRRQSQSTTTTTTQRKAVYEFGGDNIDELSFQVGDVITVIEEVDEGWWLGESIDGRRGIFPVNYTELVVVVAVTNQHGAGPPMPARPSLNSQNSSSVSIAEETRVESPFADAQKGYSYIRPNQPARTLSANTTCSPMSSPIPRQNTTTKRAPPPPPASRTPPVIMSSRSNTTSRTAPSTPQFHVSKNDNGYFESAPACHDCGCDEFTANVFKKGHCNNCFHKH
ncbi:hypothetical protein EDC94DRAFT_519637 [Helicostylum pulchrum]|nr:hypothetical protein EDC94DRAFT_519637 [Helicostylum pulchrum]